MIKAVFYLNYCWGRCGGDMSALLAPKLVAAVTCEVGKPSMYECSGHSEARCWTNLGVDKVGVRWRCPALNTSALLRFTQEKGMTASLITRCVLRGWLSKTLSTVQPTSVLHNWTIRVTETLKLWWFRMKSGFLTQNPVAPDSWST